MAHFRTAEDWIDRLGLKHSGGGEYHGPCPACGGKDRFWIATRGKWAGLYTCRQECERATIRQIVWGDGSAAYTLPPAAELSGLASEPEEPEHLPWIDPLPALTMADCRAYLDGMDTQGGAWVQYQRCDGKAARHRRKAGKRVTNPGMKGKGWQPRQFGETGPVVICEGEKDAAILALEGYRAFTMPGGAGRAGSADWTILPDGEPVTFAGDNDEPGCAAMDAAALAVRSAFPAALVLLVDLADVPAGKSVADLEPDAIDRLIDAARLYYGAERFHNSGGYVHRAFLGMHVTARFPNDDGRGYLRSRLQMELDRFVCQHPRWRKADGFAGPLNRFPLPCNECDACITKALKVKACRWDLVRGDLQTTVYVTGAAGSDHAREWTGQLAKAVRLPERSTQVNDVGEILITFPDVIPEDLADRIRNFAAADHRNSKRAALGCVIGAEEVPGDTLARFANGQRTVIGERRHITWNMRGKAFRLAAEDDYAFGVVRPLDDDETPPDGDEISHEVKHSRRTWRRIHSDPDRREQGRLQQREIQAAAWCAGKTIITFYGPPKLLSEYAEFKGGHRNYEPAFDRVAAMLGDDPPEPYRLPRNCPSCGFPYYPTPGRHCCAYCGGE